MLPLLKRHEIQVLRCAGHSLRDVAKRTGVAVKTIRRVEREDGVAHVDDAAERKRRCIGRPSKAAPFRTFVGELLAKEPELMSLEVLRRARGQGYTGSKSAMYELVAALRPTTQRPVVRFEGLAGEFSQHDFGEVDVRFVDGTTKRVHFFASRLKFSRWVEVTLVKDQSTETVVRTTLDHFAAMEGVPLLAVFDRPKTVVLKWAKDGTVAEWNPVFASVMLELGVGVELCWPYSGNQKGAVESLVKWVKGSFFKQRRFLDEEDLRQQLREWHQQVNTQTPSRATGVTPAARMAAERARLRPLKVRPEDLALRIPVLVGPTGMVQYDTNLYSMPPEAIGIPATLHLYRDRVRVVAGRHEARHERLFGSGQKSVLAEHRAEMVAAVSGKRAKRYYKREQLLGLGPIALEYLTEVVHRRRDQWISDVEQLYEMLERHGQDLLRYAMQLALGERLFGAEYVGHFLERAILETARVRQEVPS
jgi:transposase